MTLYGAVPPCYGPEIPIDVFVDDKAEKMLGRGPRRVCTSVLIVLFSGCVQPFSCRYECVTAAVHSLLGIRCHNQCPASNYVEHSS